MSTHKQIVKKLNRFEKIYENQEIKTHQRCSKKKINEENLAEFQSSIPTT